MSCCSSLSWRVKKCSWFSVGLVSWIDLEGVESLGIDAAIVGHVQGGEMDFPLCGFVGGRGLVPLALF